MNHIILLNSANILVKYFSYTLNVCVDMVNYIIQFLTHHVYAEIGKHASQRTTEH